MRFVILSKELCWFEKVAFVFVKGAIWVRSKQLDCGTSRRYSLPTVKMLKNPKINLIDVFLGLQLPEFAIFSRKSAPAFNKPAGDAAFAPRRLLEKDSGVSAAPDLVSPA